MLPAVAHPPTQARRGGSWRRSAASASSPTTGRFDASVATFAPTLQRRALQPYTATLNAIRQSSIFEHAEATLRGLLVASTPGNVPTCGSQ